MVSYGYCCILPEFGYLNFTCYYYSDKVQLFILLLKTIMWIYMHICPYRYTAMVMSRYSTSRVVHNTIPEVRFMNRNQSPNLISFALRPSILWEFEMIHNLTKSRYNVHAYFTALSKFNTFVSSCYVCLIHSQMKLWPFNFSTWLEVLPQKNLHISLFPVNTFLSLAEQNMQRIENSKLKPQNSKDSWN